MTTTIVFRSRRNAARLNGAFLVDGARRRRSRHRLSVRQRSFDTIGVKHLDCLWRRWRRRRWFRLCNSDNNDDAKCAPLLQPPASSIDVRKYSCVYCDIDFARKASSRSICARKSTSNRLCKIRDCPKMRSYSSKSTPASLRSSTRPIARARAARCLVSMSVAVAYFTFIIGVFFSSNPRSCTQQRLDKIVK